MNPTSDGAATPSLVIRDNLLADYTDVYTPEALAALEELAPFNREQKRLMSERIARRTKRFHDREPIRFLDPDATIPRRIVRRRWTSWCGSGSTRTARQ